MTTPPLIAVTMGDPAGVGPEILAKTFAEADYREGNRVVVVGDAGCWSVRSACSTCRFG